MKPILSIIIPAYNAENTIAKCIESIIYKNIDEKIEIIIIDDGSTDNTGNICEKYNKLYEYIHVIHKHNEGQGIARNVGIENSNGMYVSFIDSDDYVNKTAFDEILNDLEKAQYDLVIYNWKKTCDFMEKTENISNEYEKKINDYNEIISLFFQNNKNLNIGSGVWNKFYKLDKLKKNNIRFISERMVFSEDFLFNITYSKYIDNYKCSPVLYYNYVVNENSYCHTYQKKYLDRVKEMYECMMNEKVFNLLNLENKDNFNKRFFEYIKSCIIQEFIYNTLESSKNVKFILDDTFCTNIMKNMKYNSMKNYSEKIVFYLAKHRKISILKFLYVHKKS